MGLPLGSVLWAKPQTKLSKTLFSEANQVSSDIWFNWNSLLPKEIQLIDYFLNSMSDGEHCLK